MATISKRSMSQTLRPLSEMWDANGRIRPPQEEMQDPLTPEGEVRAEGVRMTAAKQKEAVADEKLNSDIETFIKDPERFEGAEVRRTDFGVRRHSFAGQEIYSYNANADRAEHEALAKLDDRKTFAELLTVDMPGKLEVAKQLWATAGDSAGAKAEIGAVDGFVKDNYDTLVTLTKYNGRDPLAADIAAKARGMIAGSYKTDFLTMDRDPEIKAKVAGKQALDMGLNGDAAEAFEGAAKGDPWSRTLLAAAGVPPEAAPVGAGRGQTPQAAKAAAAGVDPNYVNGFIGFANKSAAVLQSGLGAEYDLLVPAEKASVMKAAYDAGPNAGGAILDVAARVANGLLGQDKVNAFRSGVKNAAGFMGAWGRSDDPSWSALGAKALSGIASLIPEGGLARQPELIVRAGASAAERLSQYRAMGADIPDAKVPALARVLYARAADNTSLLKDDPEAQRIASLISEADRLKTNVDISPDPKFETAGGAKAPQGEVPLGMELMQTTVKAFIHKASALAIAQGKPLNDVMKAGAVELADDIASLAGLPEETARDAALLLVGVIAKDGAVNLERLPEYIRKSVPKDFQVKSRDALTRTPQGQADLDATAVERLGGRASYDAQFYTAMRGIKAGGFDAEGRQLEFRRFSGAVAPIAERVASDAAADTMWASAYMSGLTAADLTEGRAALQDKLGNEYIERLRKVSPRAVGQASLEELKALGSEVAGNMLDRAAAAVPGGYVGSANKLEAIFGGKSKATDALQQAFVRGPIETSVNSVMVGQGLPALTNVSPVRDFAKARTAQVLTKGLMDSALNTDYADYVTLAGQKQVALRAQDYALRTFGAADGALEGAAQPAPAETLVGPWRAADVPTQGTSAGFSGGGATPMLYNKPLPFDTAVPINLERAVGGLERLRTRLNKPFADAVTRQYVREDFFKQATADGVPSHIAAKMRNDLSRYAVSGIGYESLLESGTKAVRDYLATAAESANSAWEARERFKQELKGKEDAMVAAEAGETDAGQK